MNFFLVAIFCFNSGIFFRKVEASDVPRIRQTNSNFLRTNSNVGRINSNAPRIVRQTGTGGGPIVPDCSKNSQIAASIFGSTGDSLSVTPSNVQIFGIPFYILRGLSEINDVTACADQAEGKMVHSKSLLGLFYYKFLNFSIV